MTGVTCELRVTETFLDWLSSVCHRQSIKNECNELMLEHCSFIAICFMQEKRFDLFCLKKHMIAVPVAPWHCEKLL